MVKPIGYVRIVGRQQALHHQGVLLGVTDNPTLVNVDMIYVDQARDLVKRGDAQWIREGDQAAVAEDESERKERHEEERQELEERHESELKGLLRSYAAKPETPMQRGARHIGEQNAALARQAPRGEFLALVAHQVEEPKIEAMQRFDAHQAMLQRHQQERTELNQQQTSEDDAAQKQAAPPAQPQPQPAPAMTGGAPQEPSPPPKKGRTRDRYLDP